MKYSKSKHHLQQNISGGEQVITSFKFSGKQPGAKVYLQGNLHGPEIIGSVLLTKLITHLSQLDDINGTITIVPTANPIGAEAQIYGYQIGRWNMQNGKNWNRIFSSTSKSEKLDASIETKLSEILLSLASKSDIILDIHASGKISTPHLYTYKECANLYKPLGTNAQVLFSTEDFSGVFDESCFQSAKKNGKTIHVATWEAGTHGNLDEEEIEERFEQLLSFLSSINILPKTKTEPVKTQIQFLIKNVKTLHSQQAGYIVWAVKPGSKVAVGEMYAKLYQPWNGNEIKLLAKTDMYLISQYALQAVKEGQEIAKMGFYSD